MSNQPTRAVQTKRVYTPPTATKLDPIHNSSSADKLRSTLHQLEAALRLNPNDTTAAELQRSIQRKLGDLETNTTAA